MVAVASAPPFIAPTSLHGWVDDSSFYALVGDILEYVGDCMYPATIQTYSQMRRDARLTGILKAYMLPIERASWSIDPAGCRPEVVQIVADDMGLPVAGKDQPAAARTRGVSWAEHLRLALEYLVFGHAGFELWADTSSGRARLVGLLERPQATISTLHVDTQGRLLGISQDGRGETRQPEIAADRLLWLAHERSGSNWTGVSLLRASYAPWLIKREMQRILATSNRRFGIGVPTIEWDNNAAPSPAQMAAAQQLVQNARGGDSSGATLPPGARLVLQGLSGSTPDTLAFMRWLNQEMAQSALSGLFDLTDSPNGSRALGDSFLGLFLMALQSIADYIADVETRQVAARIVGWNWGEDEPVPAVKVADVGSRREVTAEALNALLTSGALSADPGLESWVRREYRLPERETPPAPKAPLAPPAKPASGEVAASARRRKPAAPPGQLALPIEDELDVAASGVGLVHPESCEEASLISPCRCGCNGTRHGESLARTRLGPIRSEQVERRDGNVRLAAMTDDELATLFARHSREENWDAFAAIDAEMARREADMKWLDATTDEHWNTIAEPTEQDRKIDALLARGYDFVEAYAEIYGKDTERLRSQERAGAVERMAGESTDAAIRRGYDLWVHDQWMRAETDTRGHLLTKQAAAKGVQAVDLFSGPTSRARKWASEDLQRWWADNQRMTFTQYRALVLGRQRDRQAAERTRLGGNARDFI